MKALTVACLLILGLADFCVGKVIVVGSLTHERNLDPGDTFNGTIVLKNTADRDEEVRIYQSDYLFDASGTSRYNAPGSSSRSNATWISLSNEYVTVPAHAQFSLFYQGTVPNDTTLSGTYWSMIMVEPTTSLRHDTVVDTTHNVSIGITTRTRYGIQVITNIGRQAKPVLKFVNKALEQKPTGMVLEVDVANTGNRVTRPNAWLEIYDGEANLVARVESQPLRILPDCSVRHRFNINSMNKGSYQALVVLDDGADCAYGARYNLVIE